MKLKDWIPEDASFMNPEVVRKFGYLEVIKEHGGFESVDDLPFPDIHNRYRNVIVWVELEDGSAVGMNESPRSGLSFPRLGKKTINKFFQHYKG